jgi:hypothetical protein
MPGNMNNEGSGCNLKGLPECFLTDTNNGEELVSVCVVRPARPVLAKVHSVDDGENSVLSETESEDG